MTKFIVDLDMDGYGNQEEHDKACFEVLQDLEFGTTKVEKVKVIDDEKEFWKYWRERWPNASADESKLKNSANYQETRAAFFAGFAAKQ